MDNEIIDILTYLEYIQSQNRSVSIVSTFKGVSFSTLVNIVSVLLKEKTIMVKTPQQQNISLLPNTQVAIHSDLFPHPVLTNVLVVDSQKNTAVLHPFEFIRGLNDNRAHVRVQTKEDTFVSITSDDDKHFSARIHDISTDGMSVIFEEISNTIEEVLQTGKLSKLRYKLKISGYPSQYTFDFPGTNCLHNPSQ